MDQCHLVSVHVRIILMKPNLLNNPNAAPPQTYTTIRVTIMCLYLYLARLCRKNTFHNDGLPTTTTNLELPTEATCHLGNFPNDRLPFRESRLQRLSLGVKNTSPCFSQFTTYKNKPQGQKQYIQEPVELVVDMMVHAYLDKHTNMHILKNIFIYVYENILFGKKNTSTFLDAQHEHVHQVCTSTYVTDVGFKLRLATCFS